MDLFGNTLWEAIVASIDAVAFAVCMRQLVKYGQTLNSLNEVPTLELDGNLKNKLKDTSDNTLKYVALRGIVKPLGSAIRSYTNDKVTGVIQKLSIKEHVIARTVTGFWSNDSRTVSEMFNVTPFVISGNKIDVEIIDPLEANIIDMDVVSDRFEPLIPTLLDHLYGYFIGFRQKGLQTTEEMLRDGTLITAIGELSDGDSGILKLQPPQDGTPLFLITSTKASLIKRIKESQNFLRVFAFISGTIAIALTSHMIYKYLQNRKRLAEMEEIKKRLEISRRERKAKNKGETVKENLCIVCSENPKEIILLPCGHVALCETCSDNIKDKCPLCRSKIESRTVAFIS